MTSLGSPAQTVSGFLAEKGRENPETDWDDKPGKPRLVPGGARGGGQLLKQPAMTDSVLGSANVANPKTACHDRLGSWVGQSGHSKNSLL